jgi:predicted DNA repair protein MutK
VPPGNVSYALGWPGCASSTQVMGYWLQQHRHLVLLVTVMMLMVFTLVLTLETFPSQVRRIVDMQQLGLSQPSSNRLPQQIVHWLGHGSTWQCRHVQGHGSTWHCRHVQGLLTVFSKAKVCLGAPSAAPRHTLQ